MLNQVLNIIFMTLTGTAQGFAMEYMMIINEKSISKSFRILYWTILALIPSLINVLAGTGSNTIAIRSAIHFTMVGIAIILFYEDALWKKILAVILMSMGVTGGELLLVGVLQFEKIARAFYINDEISSFFVGIGNFLSIICIAIIAVVWKKVAYKGRKTKYLVFFILYILNYFISIICMVLKVWTSDLSAADVWPVFTAIICEIAILAIIFSQSEKETLEERLLQEKQKKTLENIHYAEITRRREELVRLSGYNKQEIKAIRECLEQQNSNEAEKRLLKLSHKVEKTREYLYSNIPIINAILSEKKKMCDENKIAFDVMIDIPATFVADQMNLCSIFSNIVDNAIRACKQANKESKPAQILLQAGKTGEYLVIKCKNTSIKAPANKPEGTGYGMKILKDIAQKYQGELMTSYDDDTFYVMISLRLI